MRKPSALLSFLFFFVLCQSVVPAQINIVRLRDVKDVYLDESSFKFKFSSCAKIFGGMTLPCAKHSAQRKEFLIALGRWLEKYNFVLTDDKGKADAILQGELSIDDFGYRDYKSAKAGRNTGNRKGDDRQTDENKPRWQINAWLINQSGAKLWTSGDWYPAPSYGWSEQSKIEAKKLARELQYDFEKSR